MTNSLPSTPMAKIPPQRLIKNNMSLAQRIAWHIYKKIDRSVDVSDLIQVAMVGLVEAANNYRSTEEKKFTFYAGLRIRGSVIDYLRQQSNLQRSTIRQRQKVQKAVQHLQNIHGRAPEQKEIAHHLKIHISQYHTIRKDCAANHVSSLDSIYNDFSLVFKTDLEETEDTCTRLEMKHSMIKALGLLNKKELLIVRYCFFEDISVMEIARRLGVTPGRVSQIKKATLQKIYTLMCQQQSHSGLASNKPPRFSSVAIVYSTP